MASAHDPGIQVSQRGRITKRHSTRNTYETRRSSLRNLRDRLESIRASAAMDRGNSPKRSVSLSTEKSPYTSARQSVHVPKNVVLNFHNMDKELGLRPTAFSSLSSSDHFSCKAKSKNTIMDSLDEAYCRLTVDDRGQFRYFGYSSSMRVVSILPESISPSTSNSPSAAEDEVTHTVDSEALADSIEVQTHLIDMFFMYQNAALPILDENVFREAYAEGVRSEYFSKFLLYSLLLQGLKFGNISHIDVLARIYVQRARAELIFEMENPTVSTIPALCLFGYYLASLGSDRACWLYPGMAYRLIFDFGLHEDCKDLIARGLLTEVDQRVRHITLYGCYILDKLYSSFQGRPTAIQLTDIMAPTPSLQTVGANYQLVAAWVELASLLNDVISVINSPSETLYRSSSVKKLSATSQSLLKWFVNLPPELQWDPSRLLSPSPEICAIHTQFLSTTILLNRPFAYYMAKSRRNPYKKCLTGQSPETSQQICTTNAIRISKLLLTYRRHIGASKFFCTINPTCLTAGVALISDISTAKPGEEKVTEKNALVAIIDTLNELTPSYPVAGRSRDTLVAIVNSCGISDISKQLPADSRILTADMQRDQSQETEETSRVMSNNNSLTPGLQLDTAYQLELGNEIEPSYDMYPNFMDLYTQPLQQLDFENWMATDQFPQGA